MAEMEVTREQAEQDSDLRGYGIPEDIIGEYARTVVALCDEVDARDRALVIVNGHATVMRECIDRFRDGWRVSASGDHWIRSNWWTESEPMTPEQQAVMNRG